MGTCLVEYGSGSAEVVGLLCCEVVVPMGGGVVQEVKGSLAGVHAHLVGGVLV